MATGAAEEVPSARNCAAEHRKLLDPSVQHPRHGGLSYPRTARGPPLEQVEMKIFEANKIVMNLQEMHLELRRSWQYHGKSIKSTSGTTA